MTGNSSLMTVIFGSRLWFLGSLWLMCPPQHATAAALHCDNYANKKTKSKTVIAGIPRFGLMGDYVKKGH